MNYCYPKIRPSKDRETSGGYDLYCNVQTGRSTGPLQALEKPLGDERRDKVNQALPFPCGAGRNWGRGVLEDNNFFGKYFNKQLIYFYEQNLFCEIVDNQHKKIYIC